MRDIRSKADRSSDAAPQERFDLKLGSGDRDAKLAAEILERFSQPQCDEYISANCGNTGTFLHHHCYEIDRPYPKQLTEELKQKTIALVLETLEAAEAALFDRLSAIVLKNPTNTN
ncbi:hypothetical protein [Chamaesiphon minutus]|uniref:Uncharacterized protein n=1 Tax=Chamaesiphon minutus (strain ATCC 27169 / PCC 6605) TaxID=1173020 RepID=K9UQ69_CHAP6|nr:hypothetical protein [Chamaesiphon minutus]AFY96596.1 hypothetical protein Cha6605_5740 [Chamaesiphon minutus PCC 6605]